MPNKHTDHKSGTRIHIMVQNRDTNSSATQNKDKKWFNTNTRIKNNGSKQTQGYKSETNDPKSITLQHLLLMLSLNQIESSFICFYRAKELPKVLILD